MSALSERTLAVLRVMDKHIVTANEHSCGCGLDPGLIHVADEILAALNEACTIRTVEQLDALPVGSKFRIRCVADGYHLPWQLDYPLGFDEDGSSGEVCQTYELAVAAFIEAIERWCPDCRKGAVVDTDWGWECTACGQYDVAVGCVKP